MGKKWEIPAYPDKNVRYRNNNKYRRVTQLKPTLTPPPVVPLHRVNLLGRPLYVGGVRVSVCLLTDLMKMYGIQRKTLYKWYFGGVLPPVFAARKTSHGYSYIYLTSQMKCIVRVLNDLFARGIIRLMTKSCKAHIDHMHEMSNYFMEREKARIVKRNGFKELSKYGTIALGAEEEDIYLNTQED